MSMSEYVDIPDGFRIILTVKPQVVFLNLNGTPSRTLEHLKFRLSPIITSIVQ